LKSENDFFAEQVQFFMDAYILISPHEAQLTVIPFLKTKTTTSSSPSPNICSQVMEYFFTKLLVLTHPDGSLVA
jgi:hypothetical protein